jgi:uncharacterized protein YcbK (DUF882 family)
MKSSMPAVARICSASNPADVASLPGSVPRLPRRCLPAAARPGGDGAARAALREHAYRESLTLTYAMGATYVTAALEGVRHFSATFATARCTTSIRGLLDQVHQLATATGTQAPFRSSPDIAPETNQMLQREGHGVASHSLHLEGRAIDIRLADVPLADLRDAALSLQAGGVGYYPSPESNFVHVDTGRVRRW